MRATDRLDTEAGGTLNLTILLPGDGAPSSVVVVLRTPAGDGIARLTPTDAVTTLSAQVPAGTYVSVEALSGSVSYAIESEFEPVPLVITGVSPASGPAGTPVTIGGTGFSPRREDNQVFFGGIAATVVSATATTVQADRSGPRRQRAAEADIGIARRSGAVVHHRHQRTSAPVLPAAEATEHDARGAHVWRPRRRHTTDRHVRSRADGGGRRRSGSKPIGGHRRLPAAAEHLRPRVRRKHDHRRAGRAGPFAACAALGGIRQHVGAERARHNRPARFGKRPARHSYADFRAVGTRIGLFQAVDAIRSTPPFHERSALKPVKVAVVDTGFKTSCSCRTSRDWTAARSSPCSSGIAMPSGNRSRRWRRTRITAHQ